MRTIDLELPAHWAATLINGDDSGLDHADLAAMDKFGDWMTRVYGHWHCVDVADDESGDFRRWHDATEFGALACNVARFTFQIKRARGKKAA